MEALEILKKPYARLVTPDSDGSFFAEIVEFPGCFASGKTASEALENVQSVAVDWINAAITQGQNIPEPMEESDYSGKLVLRMTKGLHRRAALWADREGVSLNQFIITCLAECVGERSKPAMILALPQTGFSGSVTFEVAATNAPGFPSVGQRLVGVQQEITARTGGSVLSVPEWRGLGRRYAGG